jgi:hypothetical protein
MTGAVRRSSSGPLHEASWGAVRSYPGWSDVDRFMKLTAIAALLFAALAVPASADQGRGVLDTGFPPQTNPDAAAA